MTTVQIQLFSGIALQLFTNSSIVAVLDYIGLIGTSTLDLKIEASENSHQRTICNDSLAGLDVHRRLAQEVINCPASE